MTFTVVIPARYASTRLPGKPLLDIAGRPMLQHVFERARGSGARLVVVATDDARIREVAEGFGARVIMTSDRHRSGTERLAETIDVLELDEEEVVVNLQGDEPLVPAGLVAQVASDLSARPTAEVATLCYPLLRRAELFDPNVVKVVRDARGYALYFSRAPIPWDRESFGWSESRGTEETIPRPEHYRHIGLYAYRAGFLRDYVALPISPIERLESLEQLRVLYHGHRIYVGEAREVPGHGVDNAADLARARALLS